MCKFSSLFKKQPDPTPEPSVERPSATPSIPACNITVSLPGQPPHVSIELSGRYKWPEPNSVIVWVPDVIPDTNSMDPTFDDGHHVIYLKPMSEANRDYLCSVLNPGDIAVYDNGLARVVHRITRIGSDDKGRWFRFQGDNRIACPHEDIYLIRDRHIYAVLVVIVK